MTLLTDLAWPLDTDRLRLRPARATDLDAMWAYRRLPEVDRFTSGGAGDLDGFRERAGTADALADTLVVLRGDVVVGDLMCHVEDGWAQHPVREQAARSVARLGWTLDPAHQGVGLGTEAVSALLGLAFDGLGVRRVIAECFAANEPSWRLMERLGMRREQHAVADSLHAELGWVDGYTYALLADEWRTSVAARADRPAAR